VLSFNGDTAQICFPLADSLLLPSISWSNWMIGNQSNREKNEDDLFSDRHCRWHGIAESSDVGVDRAEWIKDRWVKAGVPEERIH
jgi:hypothetical protein